MSTTCQGPQTRQQCHLILSPHCSHWPQEPPGEDRKRNRDTQGPCGQEERRRCWEPTGSARHARWHLACLQLMLWPGNGRLSTDPWLLCLALKKKNSLIFKGITSIDHQYLQNPCSTSDLGSAGAVQLLPTHPDPPLTCSARVSPVSNV